MQKFDLVTPKTGVSDILLIASDPIKVVYLPDHIASDAAFHIPDLTDPKEYDEYEAVVCWNITTDVQEVHPVHFLKPFKLELTSGSIPFDQGTSQLRRVLGLIALGEKMYGDFEYLKKHLKLTYTKMEDD